MSKSFLTFLEEQSDSSVDQDSLLHGESLLVVTSRDSENVSFVLFSKNFSIDFLAHSLVVEVATTHSRYYEERESEEGLTSSCRRQSQFSFEDP